MYAQPPESVERRAGSAAAAQRLIRGRRTDAWDEYVALQVEDTAAQQLQQEQRRLRPTPNAGARLPQQQQQRRSHPLAVAVAQQEQSGFSPDWPSSPE
mmetsp:Transcript_29022/g.92867  ORF Transcript_29022/g.92867 Transcript_29022/m.92867 type:complete len:98 (+) Transcript_29022:73-366(+)